MLLKLKRFVFFVLYFYINMDKMLYSCIFFHKVFVFLNMTASSWLTSIYGCQYSVIILMLAPSQALVDIIHVQMYVNSVISHIFRFCFVFFTISKMATFVNYCLIHDFMGEYILVFKMSILSEIKELTKSKICSAVRSSSCAIL